MNTLRVNLKNFDERFIYSEKLKYFEKEFTYPLGDSTFSIKHGLKYDYFSFFEQLGEVHYLIIEDGNKIVGAICAILRTIENHKSWYLCDFKISKEYRGQKIYKKLMFKFFLKMYFKNNKMFSINMSSTENNKIFSHSKKILKMLNLSIESRFLSQFNYDELKKFDNEFWDNHCIISNNNKKDIVINEIAIPLYHIVRKIRAKSLPSHIPFTEAPNDGQFMYLSDKRLNIFKDEIEISFIHKGNTSFYISSAEI